MRAALLTVLFVVLCGAAQAGTQRLVLHWLPQAQFAGFLMAEEKGFYARRGVDLEIVPGGPDVNVSRHLAEGRAEFATMFLSTALERRASGMNLVHIGQIVHQSALMLVARTDSGVRSLNDLQGRRVGMWGPDFQIQPRALFKRLGIKVEVVEQAPSMDLFMRGGLDAVSAMWYNEYHTLMSYGLNEKDMTAFFFRDLDLNFPEDGLYCLRETYERDPAAARAVAQATLEGWAYVFAHPEEALELVVRRMKEHKVRANRAHQRWMLARMQDIILAGGAPRLNLDRADFEAATAALVEQGFISDPPGYADFVMEPGP
ncbi:ABC transporter substrate-binding protein [Desulfomicrobium escambiense]|uniref:ABC transporter substrate-binding protein n=1 Tax=Desulfomicrobium escambiense TaxID=29503 RepID=UPI0004225DC9|nr:ABC transporter substrate-binding protein [Desulfomicrobium escambiense]